ncbi:MAG: competence damage-inducible protein A [Candidatus Lokiarchaeota archaeon]|nr:competence damage-inducible protein A [Candidatus Lokiarchaeota archaeon]
MNLEILIVGNEILIGKFKDTNSNWLAKRITKYGHKVARITAIPDEIEVISRAVREILSRSPDMVIISGGLGPTFDDMTLKGIGVALGLELVLNNEAYESIKKAYDNAVRQGILKLEGMTPERVKMALLPQGSVPLKNTRGTAPGVKIQQEDTMIYCFPGVPMEMKAMFKSVVLPLLKEKRGSFFEKSFKFSGIGESNIAPYVSDLEKKHPNLWIKTHPSIGLSVELEVSITGFNVNNGEQIAEDIIEELKKIIIILNGKILD